MSTEPNSITSLSQEKYLNNSNFNNILLYKTTKMQISYELEPWRMSKSRVKIALAWLDKKLLPNFKRQSKVDKGRGDASNILAIVTFIGNYII